MTWKVYHFEKVSDASHVMLFLHELQLSFTSTKLPTLSCLEEHLTENQGVTSLILGFGTQERIITPTGLF
jgi:hypothetical protein